MGETTHHRRPWTVAAATAMAVGVIVGGIVGPLGSGTAWAQASGPGERPSVDHGVAADHSWTAPDHTVTAAPSELLDDALADAASGTGDTAPVNDRTAVRVATWRVDGEGKPDIDTTTTTVAAAPAAIAAAQEVPGVLAVAVDARTELLADVTEERSRVLPLTAVSGAEQNTTVDPLTGYQWDMASLAVDAAATTTRGAGVTVAVIDSGVDGTHPELAGRVLPGIDYVDPANAGATAGWADQNGHGTHVGGVVAAARGNDVGIAGEADKVTILPLRVLDANGAGYISDAASAVVAAVDRGAGVINLSLGSPTSSSVLANAMAYAQSRGVLVVAASGNGRSYGSPTSYPAAYPSVLAVASIGPAGAVSPFSTAGSYVDLAAPGEQILSTVPGGYQFMSGTSMAAPHVTAAAALWLSIHPGALGTAAGAVLTSTARDAGPAGRDNDYGFGVLTLASIPVSGAPGAVSSTLSMVVDRSVVTAGGQAIVLAIGRRSDGSAPAGQLVTITTVTRGVTSTRVVTLDGNGMAAAPVPIPATTQISASWSLSVATMPVVVFSSPALKVKRSKAAVKVTLKQAQGQLVRLQQKKDGRWVVAAKAKAKRATLSTRWHTAPGTYRVAVSSVPGQVGLVTSSWRVR
ncbi:MAG: hypothetical protein EPO13_01540 [Actinomycetota bacterium]|nr:MAG: hypothetical protein EPO13_01540 [Actinomycetota bacterium]